MSQTRHYEIVLLVHPDRSQQIQDMIARYRKMVEDRSGAIHRLEDWGRKQLAYPINTVSNRVIKAHYLCFNIECDKETLTALEDAFRFNDAVIRNKVLVMPAAPEGESWMMKRRDKEKDRRRH